MAVSARASSEPGPFHRGAHHHAYADQTTAQVATRAQLVLAWALGRGEDIEPSPNTQWHGASNEFHPATVVIARELMGNTSGMTTGSPPVPAGPPARSGADEHEFESAEGHPAGDRAYRTIVGIALAVFRALDLRFDIRGAQYFPATGPAVVASNHISYLDFAFVGLIARQRRRLVRFLAKGSVFRLPLLGPLMRAMGHIPVNRASGGGAGAYRHAARALQTGQLVGVFPEATISRAWMLKPFKVGAAALAVEQQVPLVPLVTWGGHRLVTVDRRYHLRRHMPVTISVGEPIMPGPGQSVAEVTALLQQSMAELLDTIQRDYPETPANLRDRWWLPRHLGGSAPDPVEAAIIDASSIRPDE